MNFQLHEAITVLERTPAALRALLGGLPDAWTMSNEGPDTFSAFDNVGHLISTDDAHSRGRRVRTVMVFRDRQARA
jgi:hypothetical protein